MLPDSETYDVWVRQREQGVISSRAETGNLILAANCRVEPISPRRRVLLALIMQPSIGESCVLELVGDYFDRRDLFLLAREEALSSKVYLRPELLVLLPRYLPHLRCIQ